MNAIPDNNILVNNSRHTSYGVCACASRSSKSVRIKKSRTGAATSQLRSISIMAREVRVAKGKAAHVENNVVVVKDDTVGVARQERIYLLQDNGIIII